MSSNLIRWGGLAVVLSGTLLAVKGILIIFSDADPSVVPPATLLFALGMIGLYARLEDRAGLLGGLGLLLAWIALAASAVNLLGLALGVPAPGAPDAPLLLEASYMVAFAGILVGLLALGAATLRARTIPAPWRAAPLAVGVLWFPLQGLGFVISDGLGLVLGGVAWMLLGFFLWQQRSAPARRAARVR